MTCILNLKILPICIYINKKRLEITKLAKNFVIFKQSDIDGFNSFKCSLCGEDFKLKTDEFQEKEVLELFCPNCGIPSPITTYYTNDIIEHVETIIENEASNMINNLFKNLEKSLNKNNNLTFKRGKTLPTQQPKVLFENDDLDRLEFVCCNRKAKLSLFSKTIKPFCPYCGVN